MESIICPFTKMGFKVGYTRFFELEKNKKTAKVFSQMTLREHIRTECHCGMSLISIARAFVMKLYCN